MVELSLIAKVTIVLGLVLVGTRLLHRRRASVRAVLLASGLAVVLVLPAATLVLPERSVVVPITYRESVPLVLEQVEFGDATIGDAATPRHVTSPQWPMPSLPAIFRGAWALGTLGLLLHVCIALSHLRRIRRTGVPWLDGANLVNALAARAGVRREVQVFVHRGLAAPITFGTRCPAIGLPPDATRWGNVALRHALVHELEHIRRADWALYFCARVACALYWFHPLAWIAARQLCLEAERACDDAVLRNAEGAAYADQLVSLARHVSHRSPVAALSMAARSDLSKRVRAVLDPRQARGPAGRLLTFAIVGGATAFALAIAPLRAADGVGVADLPPWAQTEASPPSAAAFEVASVRPNTSGSGNVSARSGSGSLTLTNMTLRDLIVNAYSRDVRPNRIVDGPRWIDSDRFDVIAKAPENTSDDLLPLMLRSLLAERFKLVVRTEVRDEAIYALVLARPDGTRGPNLTPSTECAQGVQLAGAGTTIRPTQPGQRACGIRQIGTPDGTTIQGGAVPLASLANSLERSSDRPVIDRTGLTGTYDVDLRFAPPRLQTTSGAATDLPTIFTAVREQLGLQLESARGGVEYLVVDSAEQPTSNDAPVGEAPASPQTAPTGRGAPPPGLPLGIEAIVASPTTGPNAPRFDAASIKRNVSGGNANGAMTFPTGQFRATNSSLIRLIQVAYGLRPTDTILGGPEWARRDGYDVDAKPDRAGSVAQSRLMLRTLLAERFNLAVRREAREMPVYALTRARSDGKLGPQISRPVGECVMVVPGFAQAAASAPERPGAAAPGKQPPLGQPGRRCGMGPDYGTIKAGSTAMPGLITLLTRLVDRPVVDRTGLTGTFDFDLRYAGAAGAFGPAGPGRGRGALLSSPDAAPEPASDAPTIFTALEEQLGLKLEATRGPVDVLVIDRAERPSEN